MRKPVLTLLLLLCGSLTAIAQTRTFAEVPWGSDAAVIKEKMQQAGFAFDQIDEDGDLVFTGSVMNTDTKVYALMTPKGVHKIIVNIMTPDEQAFATYDLMRANLIKKYGEPTESIRTFESPYFEGDGFEQTAVKTGQAKIVSYWVNESDPARASGFMVELTDRLTVHVTYESPEWANVLSTRQVQSVDAF